MDTFARNEGEDGGRAHFKFVFTLDGGKPVYFAVAAFPARWTLSPSLYSVLSQRIVIVSFLLSARDSNKHGKKITACLFDFLLAYLNGMSCPLVSNFICPSALPVVSHHPI